MVRIINWTADHNLVLAVQIHSHPEEAFHSEADNHLAALQHLNAISIVVPYFGNIPEDRFFTEAAFFSLRGPADWVPLARTDIHRRFHVLQERHELDYPPHPDHHRA
jgi:proteasome lid subunit RPN8/RPN11